METLHRHPTHTVVAALALAAGAVILLAAHVGYGAPASRFEGLSPWWLAAVFGFQVVAFAGYAAAYRRIVAAFGGPRLGLSLLVRLVATGFGAFAPGGGFALDYRALRSLEQDGRAATVRVLALGALEYGVIAPAACVAAIILLLRGSQVLDSVLWPWALAVPAGFAFGFWIAARHDRIAADRHGKGGRMLADALAGVNLIRQMASEQLRFAPAAAGIAVYWVAEIGSLGASVRALGVALPTGALIVGLATGYALTRRSMPLAGAGITEVLLTLSLVWVGLDFATALASTAIYRVSSFLLPILPGLWARREVVHLIDPDAVDRAAVRGETVGGPSPTGGE